MFSQSFAVTPLDRYGAEEVSTWNVRNHAMHWENDTFDDGILDECCTRGRWDWAGQTISAVTFGCLFHLLYRQW